MSGKRLFLTFVSFAVIMWSGGIAIVVDKEQKVIREIAAAKKAEEEALAARLVKLDEAWATSKYKDWDSFNNFKYDFITKGNCKSQKKCAEPVIVSKFDCNQVTLTLDWLVDDEVVDTSVLTKYDINSLKATSFYLETDQKIIDFVDIRDIQCQGAKY